MSIFSTYLKALPSANVVDLSAAVPVRKSFCARDISLPIYLKDSHSAVQPRSPCTQPGNTSAVNRQGMATSAQTSSTHPSQLCAAMACDDAKPSWSAVQGSMFTAVHEVAELLHAVALLDREAGDKLFRELIEYAATCLMFLLLLKLEVPTPMCYWPSCNVSPNGSVHIFLRPNTLWPATPYCKLTLSWLS
jgi:hypothetical protein